MIVAVPTLLLATLMLVTAEEPPRGVTEAALQVRHLRAGFEAAQGLETVS